MTANWFSGGLRSRAVRAPQQLPNLGLARSAIGPGFQMPSDRLDAGCALFGLRPRSGAAQRRNTVDPAQRFGDVIEFSHELENGAMWAKPAAAARRSLYDRNPLIFWKRLSAGLIVLVILLFAWR